MATAQGGWEYPSVGAEKLGGVGVFSQPQRGGTEAGLEPRPHTGVRGIKFRGVLHLKGGNT